MSFCNQHSPQRSLKSLLVACFGATATTMLLANSVLAQPPGGPPGAPTTLETLGCAQNEIARVVDAAGNWDCSAALTDTVAAAATAQTLADTAQSSADAAQTAANSADSAASAAQATADGAVTAAGNAQAVADAAQADVDALEGETTLSDLGVCPAGYVAKSIGPASWSCAPDEGGNANTDTLADLTCTLYDIAVFDGVDWVCESNLLRYVDNLDGTVTDNDTGLMWEKKDTAGGVHDVDNFYDWSSTGTARDGMLYTDFLATLNLDATDSQNLNATCFANHCDWRVPTLPQLRTILDCTFEPCIDPIFGAREKFSYWSSTSDAGNSASAWNISFSNGFTNSNGKNLETQARAVRGGL